MIATCRTEGCVNVDQGVDVGELLTTEDGVPPVVVCGPCGQPITDLT